MTKTLPTALVLLALAGAGCGSDASPDDTAARTTAPATATVSARDKGVKFAECMRSSGTPDFPDPNADGQFEYGISVSPAVWQRALDACKELQPPGTLSAKRTPEQQSEGLRFAACVRRNGVEDFPDPVQGEPLIDTTKIPSTDREGGMTILNAAVAKCRAPLSSAAGGQ